MEEVALVVDEGNILLLSEYFNVCSSSHTFAEDVVLISFPSRSPAPDGGATVLRLHWALPLRYTEVETTGEERPRELALWSRWWRPTDVAVADMVVGTGVEVCPVAGTWPKRIRGGLLPRLPDSLRVY